ncbi:class I SAM-dependent methyltransferase [Pseudooceanicola sp. CBS1P-1]|uniref:Methyltransferase domain-containing protein n=1 Tax=Pseudooceanicola albus TaxID=2692189 RepID=A0A6L7FYX1_9RHOB|nr:MULTISPECIES: class I SAM-dependent methyltransferase [Pseudooceanicola]MBT9382327.1 class I SAM-dependent methyltransferase [Pseudooceanicola endophyticus]MXN16869.1 methyltransferase domain-containing protein [Pseudooceanicola albus]
MPDIDSDFKGSIPEIYDSHLVPVLFADYGAELARRVARSDPAAVLEIAAGTGAVTRAMAPLLRAGARYVVSDLNEAMLERARMHHPAPVPGMEWQIANALALPFEDDSFDAVFCQFGVMFFPDRVKGFSEVRRVLRPQGRFLFNSWGPLEENDFSRIAVETLIRLYPDDPPLFLARTPFGYGDPAVIERDLRAAGFTRVSLERAERECHAGTADDFAFGQIYGSPLRLEIEGRGDPPLAQVRKEVAKALAEHCGSGPTRGRMVALMAEASG